MTYCTIMSASLLACYVPVVVFVMVPKNIQENVWLTVISGQMVALDNVITPLLVIYFMPRLRESLMFGNREV
ncbi:hypothetical protein BDR26DRAFT_873304 [Obelidium mucronatum]|nr:hypothetical protein BDR26DRAFT_873304 [Obelidium mucronatum]